MRGRNHLKKRGFLPLKLSLHPWLDAFIMCKDGKENGFLPDKKIVEYEGEKPYQSGISKPPACDINILFYVENSHIQYVF